eukprot:gene27923-2529_t
MQIIMTEADFWAMSILVQSKEGFTVTLTAGQSITVPSLYWHAAYNHEVTLPINNLEVTAWDVPEVLLNTFRMQAGWLEQSAAKLLNNTYNANLLWYRGTFYMGAFLLDGVLSLASRKVFGRSGFKTELSTTSKFKVVCVDNTDNGVIVDTELLSKRGAWLAVLAMAIKQHARVLTLIKVADEDTLRGRKRCITGWTADVTNSLSKWTQER